MPRKCSVCTHRSREAIDDALVAEMPNRRIAAQHGLAETAVRRHKDGHLPALLARSTAAAELARADTLLWHMEDLQQRTLTILEQAEGDGDLRTALVAIGQARSNLELLAKLLG